MKRFINRIRSKNGFTGIEFVITATIVLLGVLGVAAVTRTNVNELQEKGQNEISDEYAHLEGNYGSVGQVVEEIVLFPENLTLAVGQSKRVSATVYPLTLWNARLKWEDTGTENLVSFVVDTNTTSATITALEKGVGSIKVTSRDGSSASDYVNYYVYTPSTYSFLPASSTINSNVVTTLQLQSSPIANDWEYKSTTIELVSGSANAEVHIDQSTKKVTIKPRGIGQLRLRATIVDEVDSSLNATIEAVITINPVWSGWYATPSGISGERSRQEYNVKIKNGMSEWSTDKHDDPLKEERTEYSYSTATWTSWSETEPSSTEKESKTQYGYRDVDSWNNSDWLTSVPSDGYYKERTQYGFRTATAWGSYSTTKPSDGYCAEKKQYKVSYTAVTTKETDGGSNSWTNASAKVVYTKTFSTSTEIVSLATDLDTARRSDWSNYITPAHAWYCDGSKVSGISQANNSTAQLKWSGSKYCTKIEVRMDAVSGNDYTGLIGAWFKYKETTSGTTDWQDDESVPSGATKTGSTPRTVYAPVTGWSAITYSTDPNQGAYPKTASQKPESRKTYQRPAAWKTATGWRDSGAYTKDADTMPVTREMWRYKQWSSYSTWSASSISETSMRKVKTRTTYRYPIWTASADWFACEATGCPIDNPATSTYYDYRTTYSYPIYPE